MRGARHRVSELTLPLAIHNRDVSYYETIGLDFDSLLRSSGRRYKVEIDEVAVRRPHEKVPTALNTLNGSRNASEGFSYAVAQGSV